MILRHAPINNKLISYWKFDGNSNDILGNNNGIDTDVTYVSGKIDQAVLFNGVSSFISINDIILYPDNFYTISFWYYNTNGGHGLGGILSNPAGNRGFFGYTSAGFWGLEYSFGSRTASTYFPPVNQWIHVVCTLEPNKTTPYINSIHDSGMTIGVFDEIITLKIFGLSITYNAYLDTKIDEFGIWNRVLSQNEINRLYNNGLGLTYPFNK